MEDEQEGIVSFKETTDRTTYGVIGFDGNDIMAEISGYDLRIAFNMRIINSLEDAESVANGIADVFYQSLMKQLLEKQTQGKD